jgi:hypothetical protein
MCSPSSLPAFVMLSFVIGALLAACGQAPPGPEIKRGPGKLEGSPGFSTAATNADGGSQALRPGSQVRVTRTSE